jgi:hypothetical protein
MKKDCILRGERFTSHWFLNTDRKVCHNTKMTSRQWWRQCVSATMAMTPNDACMRAHSFAIVVRFAATSKLTKPRAFSVSFLLIFLCLFICQAIVFCRSYKECIRIVLSLYIKRNETDYPKFTVVLFARPCLSSLFRSLCLHLQAIRSCYYALFDIGCL